jgi:sterol 14-demethylase
VPAGLALQVAGLYHDLDGGFTPAAWFLPSWLPLPRSVRAGCLEHEGRWWKQIAARASFRKRDRAHRELKRRFYKLLDLRRANKVEAGRTDLLETFMTVPYKKVLGGRRMNDVEVGAWHPTAWHAAGLSLHKAPVDEARFQG